MSKESSPENCNPEFKPSVANAWLIDADMALTNPMQDRIEDATFKSIATRLRMGEPVILSSKKDETWLTHHVASKLGTFIDTPEALSNILIHGKNLESAFELRFLDNKTVEYHSLGEINMTPALALDSIEKHDVLPASFNIISSNSTDLEIGEVVNIAGSNIRKIHVGISEDKRTDHENYGFLDAGTRNALNEDLRPAPHPSIPTVTEALFKHIESWSNTRDINNPVD